MIIHDSRKESFRRYAGGGVSRRRGDDAAAAHLYRGRPFPSHGKRGERTLLRDLHRAAYARGALVFFPLRRGGERAAPDHRIRKRSRARVVEKRRGISDLSRPFCTGKRLAAPGAGEAKRVPPLPAPRLGHARVLSPRGKQRCQFLAFLGRYSARHRGKAITATIPPITRASTLSWAPKRTFFPWLRQRRPWAYA